MGRLSRFYNDLRKRGDHILIIPCIILLVYLTIRLGGRSAIMWSFPLDFANDLSSHIAKLFFLVKYGYHAVVPNWYAGLGYTLFRSYPPGWYFFTLPLYYLFRNPQIATYASIVIIYLLALVATLIIGKRKGFSWIRSLSFFLLLYANPVSIGYLLRVGRLPEFTGWLFGLVAFGILLYYKDKPINWKFGFLTLVLAGWLITNTTSFLASSPLLLGFFLAKGKRAKLYLVGIGFLAVLLVSFWLFPYLARAMAAGGIVQKPFTRWLLSSSPDILVDKITTWISSLLLFATFYFYWKSKNKAKKELLFFGPLLILAGLVFTRLIIFVPLYKYIFPDTYNIIFLMASIYLFLATKFPKRLFKIIGLCLLLFVVLGTLISALHTPGEIPHTQQDKDTLELMQKTNGVIIILGNNQSYNRAFYSYGAIYYDTRTVSGWFDQDVDPSVINRLRSNQLPESIEDCERFMENWGFFNLDAIITYNQHCNMMQECGLKEIEKKNNVCLYGR